MDKCIYQFDIEDGTNVGLRLAVSQYLPDELELRIDNLGGNKARIYLKGEEKTVKEFYELLKTQQLGEAKNPRFTALITSGPNVSVSSDRFFHKLQSEQLGKFVSAGLGMSSNIAGMNAVISGLNKKYHTISLTLYAHLGVSVLILLTLVYGLVMLMK
jgi:hypothetical protein